MSKKYKKRAGTSGIQGQLYETKLISLIYFRLKHDDNVERFSLATNRDDIGAFDDICFQAKIKGFNKPVTVFIQAKHRENDNHLAITSKSDFAKYFNSYLEIRRSFDPSSKDMIFGGKFDETECFFVMYTTAKDDPNNKIYNGCFADYLNELIGTGGCCTQPSYKDEDLDFLCKIVIKEQIKTLAVQLAKFICDESDSEMSMNDDLILRYHVILALNVFHVSEIQAEGHRIASFRQDFLTTNDEFLGLIKNILCLEVLKKRKSKENDLQNELVQFLSEPSEILTLSKLIGTVLTYKNGKLKFISKPITENLKRQLDKTNVPESSINNAAELAAKDYLLSRKLKVPALFGNKDLAIRGKPEKIEKRLNHLTSKIIELFEQSKPNNIVTIDESLGDGFLQLNGGIASAVGNILVFDKNSKLLKFGDNYESLGNLAKTWHETLKTKIENLHEYKLDVRVKMFPKLSFDRSEYDVNLVRDFYDKLLYYTNQADQNDVEEILRAEIEDHPCNDVNHFRVRSDVIFLKYHNEIQKMWMTPKIGSYLTKTSKIYENVVSNAMKESLTGVLNMMDRIKNKDYTFNENAIKLLESHGQIQGTVIATRSCVLTVAKVKQYLGNKDYVVLDLEYIFKLPLKSHNSLCKEFTNTAMDKILIIVCNHFQGSRNTCNRLENIAKAVAGKQILIITNKISLEIITEYFLQSSKVLINDRSDLTDMSVVSQKKLLATSKLKFQGEDFTLDTIIDDESAKLIDEDVLNQIINNETIIVGKTVIDYNYDKAKPFYVDRRVSRPKKRDHEQDFDDVKDKVLETLYDLEDDVVLITALPGMGKSTLLSHLSQTTKEIDPKVWIVRINLLEHARILSKWQDDKTDITTLESLKFMCQAALEETNESYKEEELLIELAESSNQTVSLIKCSGGHSAEFQLKIFLDFYNRGKLIFLFDGFDEIFPHYEKEALSLLRSVRSYPQKHKTWITSRSFNHVKSVLEQEFGLSYEIEHFSRSEQDMYFKKFWKSMISLKNLNEEQMRNVHNFLYFMQLLLPKEWSRIFALLALNPYFKVYLNFLDFIKLESLTNGIHIAYDGYNSYLTKFDICKCVPTCCGANDINPPPLHLFLLAECFHNKIKDVEERDKNWDIDVTGYIFYEYYFETKIKNIRFQEKNKIDIFIPDNKMTYEKERADTVAKHKMLGAYAIFYPHVEVFEEAVLKEIKFMIDELSRGREKTGLIRGVANNIPLFVHRSFAEYFAVEYICDLLRNNSEERQEKLWNFILNVMFVKCSMNVFDIFNSKIKMDETVISVVEKSKHLINKILLSERGCPNHGESFNWQGHNGIDRITISMSPALFASLKSFMEDLGLLQFNAKYFSTAFRSIAIQDGDSFSRIELSNRLDLGKINMDKNMSKNHKKNYLFLRIRDSISFYQGNCSM